MAVQPVQTSVIQRLIATLQRPPVLPAPATNLYADWIAPSNPVTVKRRARKVSTHLCDVCGHEFQCHRDTAKTCSGACRSKLCRSRKHVQRNYETILFAIGALQDFSECSDPVMVRKSREALTRLKKDIAEACRESRV